MSKLILLVLMLISILLVYGNMRWQAPLLSIANRWVNWILSSLLIGYFAHQWELSDRPWIILSATAFLLWFFIESVLAWLKIRVLNTSSIPLFPRYTVNVNPMLWPNQPKYIKLKAFLREQGFQEIQSIKTKLLDAFSLYSAVYKDSTGTIFLQMLFYPQKNDLMGVFYILTSSTEDGSRYITDNLALPVGGYVPSNWIYNKKPLCTSLYRLLAYHQKKLRKSKEPFIAWEMSPLDEINQQQSFLEFYNIKEGFLNPTNLHEAHGRLTSEGRYCLWKQFLFMKYLGCWVS